MKTLIFTLSHTAVIINLTSCVMLLTTKQWRDSGRQIGNEVAELVQSGSLPGIEANEEDFALSFDLNRDDSLDEYPMSIGVEVQKDRNPDQVLHYTLVKRDTTASWEARAAWRTFSDGRMEVMDLR